MSGMLVRRDAAEIRGFYRGLDRYEIMVAQNLQKLRLCFLVILVDPKAG